MNNKYIVYNNDLKFKEFRNLDPNKIFWHQDFVEKAYYDENLDTIEYRLRECKKNNNEFLDLSHLHLKEVPNIPNYISSSVKYLFINNNEIEILKNLEQFSNLEVLDVNNNNINFIKYLPSNLNEFCCKYNSITEIPPLEYLKILDCTCNMMENIYKYPNLETLICCENNIRELPNFIKLKKLICKFNKLKKIDIYGLVYLDCSYNNITKINDCPLLKDLLCRNNKLEGIPDYLPNLQYLEIFNNKFDKIAYFPSLKELYCDLDGITNVPIEYQTKLADKKIYKNYLILIFK